LKGRLKGSAGHSFFELQPECAGFEADNSPRQKGLGDEGRQTLMQVLTS
jgi:hypothetical protein